jgi:hypothetical protein
MGKRVKIFFGTVDTFKEETLSKISCSQIKTAG